MLAADMTEDEILRDYPTWRRPIFPQSTSMLRRAVTVSTLIQRRYCELPLERASIYALTGRISTRNASSPKLSETRHRTS